MEKQYFIKNLVDFFEGQGRFKACNEYTGMAASQMTELYKKYFFDLDDSEKQAAVSLFAEAIKGNIKELESYLSSVAKISAALCMRFPKYFLSLKSVIENEFADNNNIENWRKAKDYRGDITGLNFKKDWHYVLILWTILDKLKSNKTNNTINYLIENAESKIFKDTLVRLKDLRERGEI